MELYHNNKLLAKVKLYNNILLKFKGLMFSRKLKHLEGILLVSNNESILQTSIHMLFVFYPIDVLWLNKDFKVVDKKESVKPFTINIKPKFKAKYVLELPVNSVKSVKIGETLIKNSSL